MMFENNEDDIDKCLGCQVVGLVEVWVVDLDYVFVDIFGQIEIFMWLVFGVIVIEVFVFCFLIVVIYVVDIL